MKRLLLASLLLGFISPVMAKEICTLTSEVEPDVTITLKYTGSAGGIGTLNYKNKPSLGFYVGIWNGYGGQYYTARSYSPELLNEEKTFQERTKNTKEIRTGHFMNFVGNQLGRATSIEERKPGKLRALGNAKETSSGSSIRFKINQKSSGLLLSLHKYDPMLRLLV